MSSADTRTQQFSCLAAHRLFLVSVVDRSHHERKGVGHQRKPVTEAKDRKQREMLEIKGEAKGILEIGSGESLKMDLQIASG